MERIQDFLTFLAAALSGMIGLVSQDISFIALPLPAPPPTARVLFVGDMMFDRSVRGAMEAHGADFVLSCISDRLHEPDFVVGNLEGPITPNPSKSVGSEVGAPDNFVFTFPEYVAPMLYRHNFRAVSLGNNHILNFGEEGVHETVESLEQARVGYFGEPGQHSVSEIDQGGVKFSFIGYNEFDSGWTEAVTIKQIADARSLGRMPIVFAHWGDEYVPATERQKARAHRFVDAGAELVIGAHPHVIQESEIYEGKHIYYSLGNFVFDQYWNEAVRTGLNVSVVFDKTGVTEVKESRVSLGRDRRTCQIGD